jgi:hypothetical protein
MIEVISIILVETAAITIPFPMAPRNSSECLCRDVRYWVGAAYIQARATIRTIIKAAPPSNNSMVRLLTT